MDHIKNEMNGSKRQDKRILLIKTKWKSEITRDWRVSTRKINETGRKYVVLAYRLNSCNTRQVSVGGSWARCNEIMGLR